MHQGTWLNCLVGVCVYIAHTVMLPIDYHYNYVMHCYAFGLI